MKKLAQEVRRSRVGNRQPLRTDARRATGDVREARPPISRRTRGRLYAAWTAIAFATGAAAPAAASCGGGPSAAQPPAAPANVAASPSPYVGLGSRPIKALSDQRRDGLLAGAGVGYAMAAELNGHPGPKHVLELAEPLALTAEQRAAVQASFDRMHAEAVRLGAALVAAEEQLDRRFAHRHLDAALLAELTAEIARLEGELRYTHLVAHLETDALLDSAQRARYVELRGYGRQPSGENREHSEVH